MKIKFLIPLCLFLLHLAPARAQDTTYSGHDSVADVYFIEETDTLTIGDNSIVNPPKYTNRTFDKTFKDKYSGSSFDYEVQPVGKSMWARFMEWLSRLLNGSMLQDDDGSTSTAGYFWYVIAIIVILGVAYFIAWAILGKKGRWIFGRGKKQISVYDVNAEDIHEMDFATLIQRTRMEGNYRLAVRYYYLWLLKKLSNKEIIAWHSDKTNSDYYYEIKDAALRDDFKYLSYVYDHSWYGEFPIDHLAYAKAEKAFQKTLNTL